MMGPIGDESALRTMQGLCQSKCVQGGWHFPLMMQALCALHHDESRRAQARCAIRSPASHAAMEKPGTALALPSHRKPQWLQ
jgi:hypothetical protein